MPNIIMGTALILLSGLVRQQGVHNMRNTKLPQVGVCLALVDMNKLPFRANFGISIPVLCQQKVSAAQ